MPDTAHILVNLFDGTRQPIPADVKWMTRLSDGRPLSQRETQTFAELQGSSKLFPVRFFDNFFDDYTVLVSPGGYDDSGWFPVRVHPTSPATVDILTLPKDGALHFADATWTHLNSARANVAAIIQRGCENAAAAETKYGTALESRPKALACFLNIVTALADIQLPSGKTPLDYYWNIAWPPGDASGAGVADWLTRLDFVFKQDRFFCYVDAGILPDVRTAAQQGSFAPEKNPGAFHPDATESYKQNQFDVANVQLTFHGQDKATFSGPDGVPIDCVKIEPDIDYYKDLLSHGLIEVIPNALAGGLTEPATAFELRWMAGRRAGLPTFNPLYTVE
jgi:hypothetical protein